MLPATRVSSPGRAAQRAGHLGDGALAVGPRDREHARTRDAAFEAQRVESAGEELDVADRRHATRDGRGDLGFGERHAGAHREEILSLETRATEGARVDGDIRHPGADGVEVRRRRARIGDAHDGPVRAQPPGHRETREAEAEDEDAPAVDAVHRSFSVESPNSTSSIVMIQKRTTTWFSFQPFSS